MSKIIFCTLFLMGTLAAAESIDMTELCTCSQIEQKTECQLMKAECIWSNNKCLQKECSQLDVAHGYCSISSYCYKKNNACLPLSQCSDLYGNSDSECFNQNFHCTWSNGVNCEVKKKRTKCEAIPTWKECVTQFTDSTFCFWNGNSCATLEDCRQLGEKCGPDAYIYGFCLAKEGTCQLARCSDLQSINCVGTVSGIPFDLGKMNLCGWANDTCSDISLSSLNSENCFQKTVGTHTWKDGTCRKCQKQ